MNENKFIIQDSNNLDIAYTTQQLVSYICYTRADFIKQVYDNYNDAVHN